MVRSSISSGTSVKSCWICDDSGRTFLAALRLPLQAHFLQRAVHAPAQAMELIEKMQDQGDAFVVDAEILLQFPDQLRAREIDVGKDQFRVPLRDEPSGGDPVSTPE